MEKKILKVNKSWKYEGYLFVTTVDGREFKRRFRTNIRGRFKGLTTFNMWDNVYSFKTTQDWTEVDGLNIKFEGTYEEIYKKSSITDKVTAEIESKDIPVPEVKEVIEITDGPVKHERYDEILACVANNVPVYLVGPAGSGKNFTLEQIADELGMTFYFSNSVQQEYKLTGFIDAGGNYHETEFYKACKDAVDGKETIFFLDEMDASIPEVLVLLNAAIANGYFEFPNGKLNFGNNVHFVAAGNTFGNGSDEQYTGRLVLDQATLDRFAVIDFGYSLRIEASLAKGNMDLVNFIEEVRKQSDEKGIRATYSYRCITMVANLENVLPLDKVLKMAVFKGMDKDTLNTINVTGFTKYEIAFRKMVAAA